MDIMQNIQKDAQIQALLIMFEKTWQKKYSLLDGKEGRPSISDCIDLILNKYKYNEEKDDLVLFLEKYLKQIAQTIKI